MIMRTIASIKRCTERTRLRLIKKPDPNGPEAYPVEIACDAGGPLDLRVVLDAPEVFEAEIRRLRRLVRKHGGRP